MSWASTCPAAMAGLVTVFKRVPLDGEVRNGPETGDASAREVITVGYLGPDDDTAVENSGGGASADMGGSSDRETYDVTCAVAVTTGDEDVPGNRARCFEIFAAANQQITEDRTLGGAVMKAVLANWSLREDMTTGGPFARIRFSVAIDAFTSR